VAVFDVIKCHKQKYPTESDIPVFQISIDADATPEDLVRENKRG